MFFAKTLMLVFVVIWIRWTLPRLRVDQLMVMCWKYLVPIGFIALMGSAVFAILPQEGTWWLFQIGVRLTLTAIGGVLVFLLLKQSFRNIRSMKDPIDLKFWE
jgi:NADH-quinone oxidoreductase subunit H